MEPKLNASRQPIRFRCVAPEAREVCLVGDFNDWQPGAHPMTRHPDGSWQILLRFGFGQHHYHYLVDGQRVLDPRATGVVRTAGNQRTSLLMVV